MRQAGGVILWLACAAGCGRNGPPVSNGPSESVAPQPRRTELEIRRDAACDALAPVLTACAIADARRAMSPEELAALDPEKLAATHSAEFIDNCKGQVLSSRQVRVYEVCAREETECEALVECLENARPAPAEAR